MNSSRPKLDCGQLIYNTSSGSIIRPGNESVDGMRPGSEWLVDDQCEWIISPPPATQLKIIIDTSSIKNVTCADWELRVWTVTKQTGDRFSVDKLCGEAKQNNITIPQVYSRLVHVSVRSVSSRAWEYSVEWQSSGLLTSDSLQSLQSYIRTTTQQSPLERSGSMTMISGVGGVSGLDLSSRSNTLNMTWLLLHFLLLLSSIL